MAGVVVHQYPSEMAQNFWIRDLGMVYLFCRDHPH